MKLPRKCVFLWSGKPPKCAVVQGNRIEGQDVMQDKLGDPVKGHLWDLKRDKCLVHDRCNCKLYVFLHAEITKVGNLATVRKHVKEIEELLEKQSKEIVV